MNRLICALLLLLMLPGIADAYTMREHPRLFLRNAAPDPDDWLDTLRTRAWSTHSTWYNACSTWVAEGLATSHANPTSKFSYARATTAALVALTMPDANPNKARYMWYAKRILTWNATYSNGVYYSGGEGDDIGLCKRLVIGYDWMYQSMTQAQRDTVATVIASYTGNGGLSILYNLPWLGVHSKLDEIIVLYGDQNADGDYYMPTYATAFEAVREKVTYTDTENDERMGFLGAVDEIAANGGYNGYCGLRLAAHITHAEMLRSSIGDDWVDDSSHLRGIGSFWVHRLRSDNAIMRNLGKWNTSQNVIFWYSAWAGSVVGDSVAQGLATYLLAGPRQSSCSIPSAWCYEHAWTTLIWYNTYAPTEPFPLEDSWIDRSGGMISARSGWARANLPYSPSSDTTTVVQLGFFCGPDLVGTSGSGHFYISRGRDALFIGNGKYTHDQDTHYYPYYLHSYAWNCLDIHDPNEDLGWIPQGEFSCASGPVEFPEEGSQNMGRAKGDYLENTCRDSAMTAYPKSLGTYGYKGAIVQFADTADVLYARADMNESYTHDCAESRATQVEREIVWYRPGVFVIRDLVALADSTFPVRARFHTIHRPMLDATAACPCIAVEGAAWADSLGGVYRVPGMRQLKIKRTNSTAYLTVVKPTQYAGMVSIVGGPNADGNSWKQAWSPTCANYVAGKSSYEFYVEGRNFPPLTGSSTRFDTPGNEAGDWTVLVQAPENTANIEMIYAITVGGLTQVTPTVATTLSGGIRTVTVTQGWTDWEFKFNENGYFVSARKIVYS